MRSSELAKTLLMASLAATFGVRLAYAQERPQDRPKTTTVETTTTTITAKPFNQPATRWQKANDLLNKNMQTRTGENLGNVDGFVVDLDSGRILFFIVGCDGRQCAVPAQAVTLPTDAKMFTVSATKDQIKAYSFEKRAYPNFNDRTLVTQVYTHYNVQPYWETTTTTTTTTETPPKTGTVTRTEQHIWYRFPVRTQKATELIGMNVRNQQNENLGKIEDLAVDPDSGRVMYGVLSFGGFVGVGDKFFAVPWSSLRQTSADQKELVLSVDKGRLKTATGFDKKNWPSMTEQSWSIEVHKFYGVEPYWVEPGQPKQEKEERGGD